MTVAIAPERPEDGPGLRALVEAAFAPMPFSEGTEGAILDALRAEGSLLLSLTAREGAEVVGQVAFSPARVGDAEVVALGPIAVRADLQRRGIGSALIREGLARMRAARACVLIGDPGYYGRFGFRGDVGLTHGELPPAFVMGLALAGTLPRGELRFAPGFAARP